MFIIRNEVVYALVVFEVRTKIRTFRVTDANSVNLITMPTMRTTFSMKAGSLLISRRGRTKFINRDESKRPYERRWLARETRSNDKLNLRAFIREALSYERLLSRAFRNYYPRRATRSGRQIKTRALIISGYVRTVFSICSSLVTYWRRCNAARVIRARSFVS